MGTICSYEYFGKLGITNNFEFILEGQNGSKPYRLGKKNKFCRVL